MADPASTLVGDPERARTDARPRGTPSNAKVPSVEAVTPGAEGPPHTSP